MNKFNLGLHKALFTENGREAPSDLLKPIDFELKSEVIIPTQKELKPLKTSLNQVEQQVQDAMSDYDTEYYNFANKVGIEVQQSRTDRKTLTNEQLSRVRNRHRNHTLEWNKSVRDGYENLLKALIRKGYFHNPDAKTPKEIQKKYMDIVSEQYERYVWDANDETFAGVDDKLFTNLMGTEDPADVIFNNLTGAHMYKVERRTFEGRGMIDLGLTPTESENADGDTAVVETMSDKKNREFLSRELVKYLWDIRKTPGAFENFDIYFVSVSTDKPSDVDKRAISDFIEASNKITVSGDKDPALALMEAFRDNRINTDTTREEYKYILEEHGIELKNSRYLNDIVSAGNFFISTQIESGSERDQHAVYLNVLKIIEDEGGVAKAVNKLRPIVEQGKSTRKQEKKEKYESGERLQLVNPELYDFATNKLGIKDFARVRRLANKKAEYFTSKTVGEILANVNNDDDVNGKDVVSGGLKSGLQFKSAFEQIGEEKALSNLLERAKIINNASQYGLDESKFTKEEIQGGNLELILLLQDIISKPGEKLYELLSGTKPEVVEGGVAPEKLNEIEEDGKLREKAFEEAGRILTEKAFLEEYEEMFRGNENVHIENFADLQASLASYLRDNYRTGVGLGSTYSFDDWVKGLQVSAGAQIRGDGAVLGLNVSYDTTQNLGNGWTMTEGVSAGAFFPIISGDADAFLSAGLHVSADKKTIEWDTGKARHRGVDLGYNVVTNTLYGGRHDKWDKKDAIPEAARYHAEKFEKEIMWRMLDDIKAELGESKMDLSVKKVSDKVRNVISKIVAEQPDISESDREKVVNGMMRSLTTYNNVDLNQEGIKYVIAGEIAKQYELAWEENQKAEASKGVYFSGYSLGLFWIVGTTKGGAYATVQFTKHRGDGYGDKDGKAFETSSENISEWTDDALDRFNNELGLLGDNKLRLENGFVVIPASIKYKVNVNEKMKGLMKSGNNGDILIDIHTPMSSDRRERGETVSRELRIGGKLSDKWNKLDTLSLDWFADEINQDAVSELGEKVDVYNVDGLNKALDDLKKKFPAGDPIQDFEFDAPVATLLLQGLQSENKSKLIMSKTEEGHWKFDYADGDGESLEIEYQARFEMIDRKARDIADAVYAEALKINGNDNRVLHSVKHKDKKGWPEYGVFSDAMQAKDYNAAREAIKPIFTKLDSQINGANFGVIGSALDDVTDNDALGQALMSINNVFARSVKVVGGGDEYEFKDYESRPMSMGTIIAERENQISDTIKKYEGENITPEVKAAYKSLIDASSKYRQKNKDLFNKKNAPAAQLKNTVGFNLGDKTNPENPLFNPEIYDPMVDLKELEKEEYGFDESMRGVLQERAMRLFAGNEALINPVKKYLGLEGKPVKVGEFSVDGEKGKLTLDIGEKNDIKTVTLKAGMKFGYFTQCVNHTVILDDISVETEDGTKVTFASDVWENGTMKESTVSRIVSTTKVSLGLSVAFGGKEDQPDEPEEPDLDGNSNNGNDGLKDPEGADTNAGQDGGKPGEGGGDGTPTTPTTPTTPNPPTNPGGGLD